MSNLLKLFIFFSVLLITSKAVSQCPDYTGDINNLPVCGQYGDANGNSNWNWELTDKNDPAFCSMWYARTTNSSIKTAMKSPFVDASIGAIDIISQAGDYTRAKGWELLRRDFGCSGVTAYPYFVLYNKYSGLMRVFVYQPESQPQYSGILVQIQPTKNPWPATTALGDEAVVAPDKYLSSNQAGLYGKMVVSVGEPSGSSRWSLAEFIPAFDPNIQNALYTGTGLQFSIFGVMTFDIKSKIRGRSVGTNDPKTYNFNYVPNLTPSSNDGGQTFSFTAMGEDFKKFGKGLADLRNGIHAGASKVVDAFPDISVFDPSLLGRLKAIAFGVRENTSSDEGFGQLIGKASSFSTGASNLITFINGAIGFLTGVNPNATRPMAMPVYTSYDMELYGTITAKNISQTFILRVPGTQQTNNDNVTYYQCPLGIVNITNTPQADTVLLDRIYRVQHEGQNSVQNYRRKYLSLRMKNNLTMSVHDGAGLELVSAQAAIVGTVLPDPNGNASYNLLDDHLWENPGTVWFHYNNNLMRPDLDAGRLLISSFDNEKKLHKFQTPYVNLECINGLTFNADARTKVALRIKAVLRKKNDPEDATILYLQDYAIDQQQGVISSSDRQYQTQGFRLPYYTNCTVASSFHSDYSFENFTFPTSQSYDADNSIQAKNSAIVPSGSDVYFRAGYQIDLKPGFEVHSGGRLHAQIINYGYNVSCGTSSIEAFQFTGNCYNTNITAQRKLIPEEELAVGYTFATLKLYPTLSSGLVKVTGEALQNASITIVDQSGRVVYQNINKAETRQLDLNLHHLANGVYFVRIMTSKKSFTQKIVINK